MTTNQPLRLELPSFSDQNDVVQAFSRSQYARAYEGALRLTREFPNHQFGWKALGMVLKETGRLQEALAPLWTSVRLAPADAEAYNNLGGALSDLGRPDEASAFLARAIILAPDSANGYINFGQMLSATDTLDRAIILLGRGVIADPWNSDARNYAGIALERKGMRPLALAQFRFALALDPGRSAPYSNNGLIVSDLGDLRDAEHQQRHAVVLAPRLAQAHNNLGAALRSQAALSAAKSAFLRSVVLNPNFAEAYNNLGSTDQNLGRLREARLSFDRALWIDPTFAECHANIQAVKTYVAADPHVAFLEELQKKALTDKDRIYVSFALAKAYEDLGDFDSAFTLYSEGNRLRKAELGYRIEPEQRLASRLQVDFAHLRSGPLVPLRRTTPILIVGMPRSGTSLVEQILASHSDVHGGGELEILTGLVADHYLNAKPEDISQACLRVTSDYLDRLDSLNQGRPVLTDKMPANFWWLGFLLSVQPDLRVVHLVRDPRAVCWSNFKRHFPAKGLGFVYDLADLADYYHLYENLMRFWHQRFPGRIYDLRYERLTEHQESETRSLLDYCGLDWQERCLQFEKTERAVRTASSAQVRKKLYRGSSDAWRNFEKHLDPLLSKL